MWEENGEGEGLRNADENNLTHHFLEEVSSDQELVKGSEEQSLLPALRVFLGTVVGITLGIWGGVKSLLCNMNCAAFPAV